MDARLKSLLAQLSRRPFDLEHGALLRVSLVRVAADEHVLHFAMHHIVSDAWSIGVLTREFATLYQALSDDVQMGALPLAPLPVQYGDYAVWQREWLDAARLDAQLDYWRTRLGDEHPVLELPVTRKRTGLRSAEGGRVVRRLDTAQGEALRALSQRHGATLFMTLLAAYDVLLSRYSGQQDIRVGVPVAGRDRLETEGLIGFFVNTLVIRTELAGVQRFGALVDQVRTRVVEAQAHQDLPFARLVDALQPARSLGHTPLFQAMFNYTGAARDEVALRGLKVSALSGEAQTARFDLVLNVAEGDGLSVSLGYARDVFDEAVVARMLDHYVGILEQVSAHDDVYLGQITLDIEDHYRTTIARHAFKPVGERFTAQARRRGEARAVHCEGERLDYRELEAWSNRVAGHLVQRGVRADERIGLCMTRSAGLIASLLGVLKSGAAFVPLDPDYPEDRLAYMMEDAGVSRVVVDAATARRHGDLLAGREMIAMEALRGRTDEADEAGNANEDASAPQITIHPDQLAYVIYTSGSTGRPKGVAISHGALYSHLEDFIGTYGISETDRQLQSSTINFDVSLHEMLPALLCGGQVEMRGPQLWDLATTSRHLAEEGVTFSRIPTAYWQQWLREPPPAQSLRALRQITVGGEGLPGDALRQWRAGPLGHIRLDNLYGPTETTVACMYRQTQPEDVDHAIVSIGVPYGSRTVYVLDEAGNEAPVGGLGELCIGGETLARGYLNRAAQTAEKFIPDPYREDGARLYRTGDLCRRREDGTIDFLGRLDQQVKLRGFRIELGEIEAVLRQVEGVREAVVELKGEGEGRRLVGYVSGAPGVTLDAGVLRAALEARLPGYMVPGAFVMLARLPVMQNGKVDRRALPEPEAQGGLERVAPRTPLEATLLGIWQGVLGRDDIGVTDNFFEVGGDSLRALKVVQTAKDAGQDNLPLEQLFTHPTIAALAAAIEIAASSGAVMPTNIVRMNTARAPSTLFAIHPLYGLVAEYRALAQHLNGVVTVFGVQAPYYDERTWWPADLGELAADYAQRIRQVQPDGPYNLLGWSLGGVLVVEVAHRLEAQGQQVEWIGLVDSAPPHVVVDDATPLTPAIAPRHVEDHELDKYRMFPAEADKWRDYLPGDAEIELLRAVALMSDYFTSVVRDARRKTLRAPRHHWWAGRLLAAGNPLVSMRQSEWPRYAASSVTRSAVVDANHMDLLHHPDFLAAVHDYFTFQHNKVSDAA